MAVVAVRRTFLVAALAVAAAAVFFAGSGMPGAVADTGPRAELWERWTAHDPMSRQRIDHDALSAFLDRYREVGDDGIARLRYAEVTDADRSRLDGYVRTLEAVPISGFSRPQQFAYWVNLYNAATLRMILDAYPVDSILDVDLGGWFSFGPWGADILEVEGHPLSLDDIEHRILRPIWRDSRVHYAVNCASLGCPNLAATAYAADRLEAMLETAARDYVNHPRGVRVVGGKLVVSSLYRWFESDFVRADGSVLAHIRRYADARTLDALRHVTRIFDIDYSWKLNDATAPGRNAGG